MYGGERIIEPLKDLVIAADQVFITCKFAKTESTDFRQNVSRQKVSYIGLHWRR